jgi:hypothetical protein
MYGFNPYMDQIDTINQIMKGAGEKNESAFLRKLVDEALTARRNKDQLLPLTEQSDNALSDRFQTIETLLMRLIRQGEISLRIEDVCLALLQDVLAEAHAGRRLSWESLVAPQLRKEGVDVSDLEQRFMLQNDQAKIYAYGVAQRIKQSQEPPR